MRQKEPWQLLYLSRRLRSALQKEGVSFDKKPFRAHITLARKTKINSDILKNWPEWKETFYVNEITLFHSTRVNGVLTYLPIGSAGFEE